MKISAIQLIFTLLFSNLYAQTFEADTLEIANFPVSKINFSKWGDLDNDSDLDLLISWIDTNQTARSSIIENTGNAQFVLSNTVFIPVTNGKVEFLDFDKDNDLDVFQVGIGQDSISVVKLYINENGIFQDSGFIFPELKSAQVTSLDYNNDGYPDIILNGILQNTTVSILLENEGDGLFSEVPTSLPGLKTAQIIAPDLNNDNFSDVVICGLDNSNSAQTQIHLNNSGTDFSQLNANLTGFFDAAISAGDFDNDGDFDILISGQQNDTTKATKIVRNDGNDLFTEVDANLPLKAHKTAEWGDFDNDGNSDVFLFTPDNPDTNAPQIYPNNGTQTFSVSDFLKKDTTLFEVTFADIDNDADLDFLAFKKDTNGVSITRLFINNSSNLNTPPQPPSSLSTSFNETNLIFFWNQAEDLETSSAGLSYNIRIGTTPGGSEIFSSVTGDNGFGKTISSRNHRKSNSLTLPIGQLNSNPQIHWSVQSIDPAFARSPFSNEQVFIFDFTENKTLSDVIAGVNAGSSDWGDFDNDNDLDLLLTGQDAANGRIAKIYRNDGDNQMTELDVGLTGVASSSAIWFDYNSDNMLDILISGFSVSNNDFAEIYKNNGDGTFSSINSGLKGAFQSEVDWGDFDNDGDADIIQSGFSLTLGAITTVYRNEIGKFTEVDFDLPQTSDGATLWCDFDNDGLLDIFISGTSPILGKISKIYRNTGSNFVEVETELPATSASSAATADYDNDGDSDLLLTGLTSTQRISKLFINQGNMVFEASSVQLEGVSNGSAAFGDRNNDGYFDIMLSGFDSTFSRISKVYTNNKDNTFSELTTSIQGVIFGTTDWVDIDNDNDLDIFVTGSSNTERVAIIYQNNSQNPNTIPDTPGISGATLAQTGLNLNWLNAQDLETPEAALTYNLRIGSTPGGSEILSAISSSDGYRKVVKPGNIGHNNSFTLLFDDILDFPSVYWSVQAIDNNFTGSVFSEEGSLNPVISAISDVPNDQGGRVTVQWQASSLDHDLNTLTSYSVWRSLPDNVLKTGKNIRTTKINQNTFAWEWLTTLPAHRRPVYSYTSETLYDSTSGTNGAHFFIIAAHTNDANIFFDSLPISGHSIDNIAPEAPQNLITEFDGSNIMLTWKKNTEPDLKNYLIYRSENPGIDTELIQPYARNITDTVFINSLEESISPNLYFVVAAQDSSDNISLASKEVSFTITDVQYAGTGTTPENFSLYQNYPNPFNPNTQIKFDLPKDSHVKIQVFNIKGETITTLLNAKRNAGFHTASFDAKRLPSGTYFYRIVAGDFIQTRKMTLLR